MGLFQLENVLILISWQSQHLLAVCVKLLSRRKWNKHPPLFIKEVCFCSVQISQFRVCEAHKQCHSLCIVIIIFFILCLHFKAVPWHMEVPRLGVESELQLLAYTTATTQDPSCVCSLHHSSQQHQILNPLSESKDRTHNLMVPSQIRFPCTTTGTPLFALLTWICLRKNRNHCRLPFVWGCVFFMWFHICNHFPLTNTDMMCRKLRVICISSFFWK